MLRNGRLQVMPYRPGLARARQIRLKRSDEAELIRLAHNWELSIADIHRKAVSIGMRAIKRDPGILMDEALCDHTGLPTNQSPKAA